MVEPIVKVEQARMCVVGCLSFSLYGRDQWSGLWCPRHELNRVEPQILFTVRCEGTPQGSRSDTLTAPRLLSLLTASLFAVYLNISVPIRAKAVHFMCMKRNTSCVWSVAYVREGYTRTWSPVVARFLTVTFLSELQPTVGFLSWGRAQTWRFYISCALLSESPSSVVVFLKPSI